MIHAWYMTKFCGEYAVHSEYFVLKISYIGNSCSMNSETNNIKKKQYIMETIQYNSNYYLKYLNKKYNI